MTWSSFAIGTWFGICVTFLTLIAVSAQQKKPEPIDLRQVSERTEAKIDQLRDLLAAHDESMQKACAPR